MVSKESILERAVHDCMAEMYAKAQPEADWDNLIEEYRTGKIGKDERVYERHYLSMEEFKYILEKYVEAYRLNNKWIENIDLLESYLLDGGHKDKYIEGEVDEDGTKYPGHRGYEKVDPMVEHIKAILSDSLGSDLLVDDLSKQISDKVFGLISDCKEFYRRNIDEEKFRFGVTLGASPSSSKESVIKWWKDNYDVDIEIEDRNPLLLWEMDFYGDDFEKVMEDEDGENWKEIWDQKWKKEQERQKKLQEGRLVEYLKKNKNEE